MNAAERQALVEQGCWLCGRTLGQRVQWHHFVPKSRGGKDTVPVHPICHAKLHKTFTNTELQRFGEDIGELRQQETIAAFVKWIANKPSDFHAPTRKSKH